MGVTQAISRKRDGQSWRVENMLVGVRTKAEKVVWNLLANRKSSDAA